MYYKLTYSIGNFIESIEAGYNYSKPDSIYNLKSLMYNDKSHLDFDGFKYPVNQDWNDYVGCTYLNQYFSALISINFLENIKDFNIVDHSIVRTKVVGPLGSSKTYCVLLLNQGVGEYVDFEKSDLYLYKGFRKAEGCLDADVSVLIDHINGTKLYERSNELRARKIVLKEDFDFDLFSIWNIGGGILVSEKLKNAIESLGLKGMEFKSSAVTKI